MLYSSARLIATALIELFIIYIDCSISNLFYVPKPAFNVNFVPLIVNSPISNEISYKYNCGQVKIQLEGRDSDFDASKIQLGGRDSDFAPPPPLKFN